MSITAACTPDEGKEGPDAPVYDDTSRNLALVGSFAGMDLDLRLNGEGDAEREYRGPPLAGTDPIDEIPDVSQTALCEMEVHWVAVIDDVEWELEFELENFDVDNFGTGDLTIASPDEGARPGATAVEFQMTSDEAEWEKTAVSGHFDIRRFEPDSFHEENPDVELGGFFGGTFELDFGPNESVEGSFHLPVTEDDIAGSEC